MKNIKKVIRLILATLIMVDWSLHCSNLAKIKHPLSRFFPSYVHPHYELFWTVYWGLGLFCAVALIVMNRKGE